MAICDCVGEEVLLVVGCRATYTLLVSNVELIRTADLWCLPALYVAVHVSAALLFEMQTRLALCIVLELVHTLLQLHTEIWLWES